MTKIQWSGLLAGLAIFILLLLIPAPAGLSEEGWRLAAVAALMASWWMTEAIPIEATGLVPLVLFPILGVLEMSAAAAPYANELIFLFLGGFLIAFAMERWKLHARIALGIVAAVGTGPRTLVLGFMLATAFISMWISNTATTAMMYPIAIALGEMFRPKDQTGRYQFGIALMLGTAYAASIGGVATLIGTPPNAVMAGAANEMLGIRIGFVQWMMVGVPVAAVILPVAWLLLMALYPPGELIGDADSLLQRRRDALGPASRGEKVVGTVFVLTALCWMLREEKAFGSVRIPGIDTYLPFVTDSTIAVAAALSLFLIPVDRAKGIFALDWKTASRIPWGVLILFGGGLSLARAMEVTGFATWIGGWAGRLGVLPALGIVVTVVAIVVLLSELASNTAAATMAMPILAGVAAGVGIAPLSLMASAALAASMGFMLPAATPPNAIVFGSGYLTIPDMVKAGLWLDLVAIAVITVVGVTLVPRILG